VKHALLVALVTCASVVAVPSEAAAQERKGLFGSVGIGLGATEAEIEPVDFWVDREIGRVTEASVGWRFNRHFALGMEVKTLSGDLVETPQISLTLANVSGAIWIYPGGSNFFIKGGLGPAYLDMDVRVPGVGAVSGDISGFGYTAGAGYDIRLGRIVSLTPAVGLTLARPEEDSAVLSTPLLRKWTQNTLDFTVSIKFN
jgi:hypothetical protein